MPCSYPRGCWGRHEDKQYFVERLNLPRLSLLSFATFLYLFCMFFHFSVCGMLFSWHPLPPPFWMTLHVLQKIERDDVPVDLFRRIIGKYRQDDHLWCRFLNFFLGGLFASWCYQRWFVWSLKYHIKAYFTFTFCFSFIMASKKKRSAKGNWNILIMARKMSILLLT